MPVSFFLDTEFIEDGETINLISIGIVRMDGEEYYAEVVDEEIPWEKADRWVLENIRPLLSDDPATKKTLDRIAYEIVLFVNDRPHGTTPNFWGWFCAYDWVVFARLFGRLIDLPHGFPMFCNDLKTLTNELGNPPLPKQEGTKHNALEDAKWNLAAYKHLRWYQAERANSEYATKIARRTNNAQGS